MYDIVLFGATGFTGALTARYLASVAGPDVRWALAGRDRAKLEALGLDVPVIVADARDPAELVSRARVVASTVGPYLRYGEPLVRACAESGTHYLDLTGEPEFVDRMFLRYDAVAARSGAKIVHACGFDSIPWDLGVLHTVLRLPEGVPLKISGFLRGELGASGGTFASALTILSRLPHMVEAGAQRRAADRPPAGRRVRSAPGGLRYVGGWAVPMPTIDYQVVGRSARLLDRYGPDFAYRQYFGIGSLPAALGAVGGALALTAMAQIPPARDWLARRLPAGTGPSPEQRARHWFRATILGEGGGRRVVTRVSGGDAGYDETAKMLAESALCLAFDDTPKIAGSVTPASAMGEPLIRRLQAAGISFT